MGDRALVQFKNNMGEVSPVTYLHCAGDNVSSLLVEHRRLMEGRYSDLAYSPARFIGICHERDADSNLSLGCWNASDELTPQDSHGDAGCFVVNVDTGDIETFGGYGFVLDRENFITSSEYGSESSVYARISEEGIYIKHDDTMYLLTQDAIEVLSET